MWWLWMYVISVVTFCTPQVKSQCATDMVPKPMGFQHPLHLSMYIWCMFRVRSSLVFDDICIYVQACMRVHACKRPCVHVCACVRTCTCAWIHERIHVCVSTGMHVCIYHLQVYKFMYHVKCASCLYVHVREYQVNVLVHEERTRLGGITRYHHMWYIIMWHKSIL